jgi:hypothetical protein
MPKNAPMPAKPTIYSQILFKLFSYSYYPS